MRTTIRLPDDLLRQVKARAAADGRTLNSIIEEAVRRQLLRDEQPAQRPSRPLPVSAEAGWVHPDIDIDDNASVLAAMEACVPFDRLR